MKTIYHKALRINRYYKLTNFYSFLKDVSIKGAITVVIALIVIYIVDAYVLDLDALLNMLVEQCSQILVLSTFLISESLLGIIPPEIFIAWSGRLASPWLMLFILASLSYLGGIVSYGIGHQALRIPVVKEYITQKLVKHISNLRKWGGFLVFVGAMLPIPHSLVSMACGLINYKFRHYVLWALFRYLRFFIYGLIIYQMV